MPGSKNKRVKIGDIIEIPFSNSRKVYCQYVFLDKKQGALVQFFDLITNKTVSLEQIITAKPLFPPVIIGIFGGVKTGIWKVVGNTIVSDFRYPKFVSPLTNEKEELRTWYLWDGDKYTNLGIKLPDIYKNLEELVVWGPSNIIKRIETGINPYDVNRFTND